MDEKLKEKLNESLTHIIDWVERNGNEAENFLREQTPLVIQELINWNFYFSLILGTIFLLLGVILLFLLKPVYKWLSKTQDGELIGLHVVVSVAMFFLSIIYFIQSLKITIAPRLFILEYIKSLIE